MVDLKICFDETVGNKESRNRDLHFTPYRLCQGWIVQRNGRNDLQRAFNIGVRFEWTVNNNLDEPTDGTLRRFMRRR